MEENPTWMPVVALALRDEAGRLLLQKRLPGKRHGGLWEFPGGKVENGETPRFALVREIAEELTIGLSEEDLEAAFLAEEGGGRPTVLMLYTCHVWRGDVVPLEGQEWGWFSLEEAARLAMPPMDKALLVKVAR